MSVDTIPFTALVRRLPAAVPFVGPENWGLRHALADKHGVAPDEILVGAGVDSILGNTVRMLAGPGTPVVTSAGAYPTFNYHVAGFGAVLQTAPYRTDTEDPEAILNKVRNHFEMSRVSQIAALASLHNPDFVAGVVAEVARGRADYADLATRLGLKALPSATNFVAIDMGGDGDNARATLQALDAAGVFVRMPGVAPLDRCIRVTVGTEADRAIFAERFEAVVGTL